MLPDLLTPPSSGLRSVAHRTAASDDLGWQHVHVATWEERPAVDHLDIEASSGHRLVMVTHGRYVIESRRGSGWQRALQAPGAIGLTPARKTDTLRWRSAATGPLRSAHVHLDVDVVEEARLAFSVRGSHDFLDALHVMDPGVQSTVRDLLWALDLAAPALYADTLGLVLAAKLVTGAVPTARRPSSGGLDAAVLARVVEYLTANLAQPITLADLSAVANLSKHHFLRQFKTSTGQTPHQLLRQIRMEHAERLLARGNRTIGSVARMCGYASDRQFSSAFARHAGASPTQWRASRSGSRAAVGPDPAEPFPPG